MAKSINHAFRLKVLEFVTANPQLPRLTRHINTTYGSAGTFVSLDLQTLKQLYQQAYEEHMHKPHNNKFFNGMAQTFLSVLSTAREESLGTIYNKALSGPKYLALGIDITKLQ